MSKLTDFLGGIGGGSGIGGMPIQIVSSDTLLSPNFSYGIDTSQGVVEVTLPASPIPGDRISFFDAALTWSKNPAMIHVNGNSVQGFDSTHFTTYPLESTGVVQELLFIGSSIGWKDISLYDKGATPHWYGSFLGNDTQTMDTYYLYNSFLESPISILDVTKSSEVTTEQGGVYCIQGAGGTGSYISPVYGQGRQGGDTIIKVDGNTILTCKGGPGSDTKSYSGRTVIRSEGKRTGVFYSDTLTVINNPALFIKYEEEDFNDRLTVAEDIDLPTFIINGAEYTRSAHTASLSPSSILINLAPNQLITVAVGSGASGGSDGTSGAKGRATIHYLGGMV